MKRHLRDPLPDFEPGFLRMLLMAIDTSRGGRRWSLALWLGALSPFRRTDTALRSCAVVAALILMAALLTASQKLYRARVCAVRSVEISRLLPRVPSHQFCFHRRSQRRRSSRTGPVGSHGRSGDVLPG